MADLVEKAEDTGESAFSDPSGVGKMLFFVMVGAGLLLGAVALGFQVISGRLAGFVTRFGRGVLKLGSDTIEDGAPLPDFEGSA